MVSDINLRIGGAAGLGVMVAGAMISKAAKKEGLYVFLSTEYPSLIRGGHNTVDIRISSKPIHCNSHKVDVLLALNTDTIERHYNLMNDGGIILYDSSETQITKRPSVKVDLIDIPIVKIAEQNGSKKMMNTVIVAAALAILEISDDYLKATLKKTFGKKGEEIVKMNIACADAAKKYVMDNHNKDHDFKKLERHDLSGHLMINGNDAIAMGALKAGCKFMAAYPMTPATSVMETMAKYEHQMDFVLKQTEDELTAINMAVGAGFAGVRALTASSGGGFSLMVEGIGAAIEEETPVVIVLATRPGPGTGMATYTGQGDINLAVYAGTDDAPRIVLAPGDQEECFYLAFEAFNWAEEYQTPVIIMTDKQLATSEKIIPYYDMKNLKIRRGKLLKQGDLDNNPDYVRYKLSNGDPISPRAIPGIRKGMHTATTYAHDEKGIESEDPLLKKKMLEKIFAKMALAKKNLPLPKITGEKDADISILTWGSSKQYIDQVMEELKGEMKIRHMNVNVISPFPTEAVTEFIDSSKKLLLIEQNYSGQFNDLVKLHCQRVIKDLMLKYDGYTLDTEEIKSRLRSMRSK